MDKSWHIDQPSNRQLLGYAYTTHRLLERLPLQQRVDDRTSAPWAARRVFLTASTPAARWWASPRAATAPAGLPLQQRHDGRPWDAPRRASSVAIAIYDVGRWWATATGTGDTAFLYSNGTTTDLTVSSPRRAGTWWRARASTIAAKSAATAQSSRAARCLSAYPRP